MNVDSTTFFAPPETMWQASARLWGEAQRLLNRGSAWRTEALLVRDDALRLHRLAEEMGARGVPYGVTTYRLIGE